MRSIIGYVMLGVIFFAFMGFTIYTSVKLGVWMPLAITAGVVAYVLVASQLAFSNL